ncbi:MlaA family lipoprotein [Azospirillum sp. ST 5-10]|uniref:MlaA family lipoprotein n=1 Tax=unclassified Azospirillum TaxID=2630922 RepID=UPI003F4A7FAB
MFIRCCATLVLTAGLLLTSAAPAAADDPLERFNRAMFAVNGVLQDSVLVPAAALYADTVPAPVRRSVANVFANLREPLTAVNSGFQGDFGNAGVASARFAVNSTIGLLGLFDPAAGLGLESRAEDLGQTLCAHGVPEGAFLILPFTGPTTVRDLTGTAITLAAGASMFGDGYLTFAATDSTIASAEVLAEMRQLERFSLDPYAWQRSAYLQHRQAECRNGARAPFAVADAQPDTP